MNLCTFRVGALLCAVPAEQVREVTRVGALTPVPGAPAQVAGVLNVRGQVLCAVQAATRLGQPSTGVFTLLVWHQGRSVAVLADAIVDIGETTGDEHPTPATVPETARAVVRAVVDTPAGMVHLLDIDEVIGR